jgi:hypothetical protein
MLQPYRLHNWSIAFDIAAQTQTPSRQPGSE